MSDDASPLASFSLTHVYYDPSDPLSHVCAWLALLPQILCVVYVTSFLVTREAEVLLAFVGQMGCEAVNFAIKRIVKEQRPPRFHGRGYGMPSSHAQFAVFWAVTMALFLLVRHGPRTTASRPTQKGNQNQNRNESGNQNQNRNQNQNQNQNYVPSRSHPDPLAHTPVQRAVVAVASLGLAGLVAWSRIYLNYHTPRQVLVGCVAGSVCSVGWFATVSALRTCGLLARALDTPLARYFRIRDLIVHEDPSLAGWEKWEELRLAGRQAKER